MKLIGIDPGLAAFGVCVAEVSATELRFKTVEVWTTKPAGHARRLRKSDDTGERSRTIAARLHQLIVSQKPVALCIEATALPFGRVRSSVVSMLGRVRGVVDALAEVHQLPVLEETPQRIKLAAAGAANANKDAVREALESTHPELSALWPTQSSLLEHAADACATVHACRTADVVLAALRARAAA